VQAAPSFPALSVPRRTSKTTCYEQVAGKKNIKNLLVVAMAAKIAAFVAAAV
jgi:hypothetical protein